MVRGNGTLAGQCFTGMVWGNRSLAGELPSSVAWRHRSLAWELATYVARLARKCPSGLVRGSGPSSLSAFSLMRWDGVWESTRSGMWRHPSSSNPSSVWVLLVRTLLVLGLFVAFMGFKKLSVFSLLRFAMFLLATGGVLSFAFAMLVLLALPIESYCQQHDEWELDDDGPFSLTFVFMVTIWTPLPGLLEFLEINVVDQPMN